MRGWNWWLLWKGRNCLARSYLLLARTLVVTSVSMGAQPFGAPGDAPETDLYKGLLRSEV